MPATFVTRLQAVVHLVDRRNLRPFWSPLDAGDFKTLISALSTYYELCSPGRG